MSDLNNRLQSMFRLKKPCPNCPFRKDGAISLEPGRLDGIIENLLSDDWSNFQCHKTVHHSKTGGHWDDDGHYTPSGKEAMCAGAAIYLEKTGRPTVAMRLGMLTGTYSRDEYMTHKDQVIDPPEEPGHAH